MTMRFGGLIAVLVGFVQIPVLAQIGVQTPEQADAAPYIACRAWFGVSDTIYTTNDAPNDRKGYVRFRYHADQWAKAQGRDSPRVDCTQFREMGDDLRNDHTVGFSYYSDGWKRQVTIAAFPGLPDDWSKRPVPGEDGDKPKKKEEPSELRTITFAYPSGTAKNPGYDSAAVDVKYRLLACAGEVHVAYGLDPSSIRASDRYHTRNGLVPVGDTPATEPISIEMAAVVVFNPFSKNIAPVRFKEQYGRVADKLAAPALGYGCFTGQTQKIGLVADFVPGKHTPEQLDAILNDSFVLRHQFIGSFAQLPKPLRNAALDDVRTSTQIADEKRAAEEQQADAERRRKFVEEETARVRAREAKAAAEAKAYADAQAKYQRDLAAKAAADAEYAANMARYRADVERAAADRRAYDAAMEEYRRTGGRGGKPNP